MRRVLWAATVRNKPLHERLVAAQIGQFTHLTVFPSDFARWEAEGITPPTMRQMMDDAGVGVLAIDPFGQWVPDFSFPADYPDPLRSHFDFTEADVFRMAETLNAIEVNVVEPFRGPWRRTYSHQSLVDAFAGFAERAKSAGFVTTIEFMPISSVDGLETAWSIVRDANQPDTGICFDTWHFVRSNSSLELLRTMPGDKIAEVQISDARREPVGDLINDLLHHRLLPGDGDFPLADIIGALRKIGGYTSVGPEIFSDVFDAMDYASAGKLAGDALNRWAPDGAL